MRACVHLRHLMRYTPETPCYSPLVLPETGANHRDFMVLGSILASRGTDFAATQREAPGECCQFDDTGSFRGLRKLRRHCNRPVLLLKDTHEVQSWVP
jgi:hypothetical protein